MEIVTKEGQIKKGDKLQIIGKSILDDQITKNIFEEHLKAAGIYIGIGTFRPIKGGYHGRFSVTSLEEIK